MTMPMTEFYRLDPLTGCNNFLSFVETLDHMSAREEKSRFSILYTDINYLQMLNETRGHAFCDSVIRWLEIVLQEECKSPIYRIGGDDFAVILTDGTQTDYEELLSRIFARSNREGEQLGMPSPPAKIALIHYDADNSYSINDVLFHLWEAIRDVKKNKDGTINIFWAQNLIKSTAGADEERRASIHQSWEVLRYIANNAIGGIVGMGRALDTAQRNSFLDSISGLPNMRAALFKMEQSLKNAASSGLPFSIMLMDSDNLRLYNNISYAIGDEMIQKMSVTLSEKLRPGDFVARWRTGDEFIVILPNTKSDGALVVGERFCAAVREASQSWRFSTSISIGIATYPLHGNDINALIDNAESALKSAKKLGKDRAILAE